MPHLHLLWARAKCRERPTEGSESVRFADESRPSDRAQDGRCWDYGLMLKKRILDRDVLRPGCARRATALGDHVDGCGGVNGAPRAFRPWAFRSPPHRTSPTSYRPGYTALVGFLENGRVPVVCLRAPFASSLGGCNAPIRRPEYVTVLLDRSTNVCRVRSARRGDVGRCRAAVAGRSGLLSSSRNRAGSLRSARPPA